MNAGEIAALLMAAAALITAISNARNGKDVAEKLRKQNEQSEAQNKKLIEHNVYQDALLLDRELKIDKLTREAGQYQTQIDSIGRMVNQLWNEVGYLQTQSGLQPKSTTRPLPELPHDDD